MEQPLVIIENAVADKKGEDCVVLDVTGKTSIADYLVICHGDSDRQVQAIAKEIEDRLRTHGSPTLLGEEGMAEGKWILLDYGHIIVHIFRREVRDLYRIEDLWEKRPSLTEAQA